MRARLVLMLRRLFLWRADVSLRNARRAWSGHKKHMRLADLCAKFVTRIQFNRPPKIGD